MCDVTAHRVMVLRHGLDLLTILIFDHPYFYGYSFKEKKRQKGILLGVEGRRPIITVHVAHVDMSWIQ